MKSHLGTYHLVISKFTQLFYSEAGTYDRVVIQELLKEIAQTQQVDLSAKQRFKGWFDHPVNSICLTYYIVVIINEADSLSRDAQAALRRTMEKYMSNMRIILCANSTSRLIAPIKSRCLLMRVAAPNPDEVYPLWIKRKLSIMKSIRCSLF